MFSILTPKLTAIQLEIIILTLAQKVNVNSNIHLFGKAVFEGTLTLGYTLLLDNISNIYMFNSYTNTYSNPIGNHHPHISTEGECKQYH